MAKGWNIMGNKYTVTAGSGTSVKIYVGTEWLVVALWNLWKIKIDLKKIYWKKLQI